MPTTSSTFSKRYHSISEVADQFGVNTSLLRYWEKEFPSLNPKKHKSGKRGYTASDIDTIAAIHNLLKGRGYTLDGARKTLRSELAAQKTERELFNKMRGIRAELASIAEAL